MYKRQEEDLRTLVDGCDYLLRGTEVDFSRQIALAETWINAYLEAAGVEVPLGVAPGFISLATANYAAFLVTNRPDSAGSFADYAAGFKAEAEKLLQDYLNGKADIPGDNVMPREDGPVPMAVNPGAG